jgi:RecA/RadA recombinase
MGCSLKEMYEPAVLHLLRNVPLAYLMKEKKIKDPKKMNAGQQIALIKRELGYQTFERPPRYWLDTGSPRLNSVVGSRELGAAYGKMIVLAGDYSSGKTLLGTKLLGLAQADGAECGHVDIENSADPAFALKMGGLDFGRELRDGTYEKVALFRPEVGVFGPKKKKGITEQVRLQAAEELFTVVERWMMLHRRLEPKGKLALLVDSTTAIVPEEEMTAGIADQNMRTRLSLPVFLNMLTKRWQHVALNTNTLIILISQIRINPTAMWGNPERIPGGKGLVFYPAVVAQLRRSNKGGTILDDDQNVIGIRSTIKNLKNKTGGQSVEGRRIGFKAFFDKNRWKFLKAKDVEV